MHRCIVRKLRTAAAVQHRASSTPLLPAPIKLVLVFPLARSISLELGHLAVALIYSNEGPRTTPFACPFNIPANLCKSIHCGGLVDLGYSGVYPIFGRILVRHRSFEQKGNSYRTSYARSFSIPRHPAIGATADHRDTFVLHVTVYHLCIAHHGLGGRTSFC